MCQPGDALDYPFNQRDTRVLACCIHACCPATRVADLYEPCLRTFFPNHLDRTMIYVYKRDGRKEVVRFDKVTARVSKLCYGLDMNFVDPIEITRKVRCR